MRSFAADFETNVSETDCRVWAYSICEIGKPDNFIYGNNIDDFMNWCANKKENYTLYFHNLKFDGEYIFSYLLSNNFEVIKDKKERKDKSFTCLISNTGQFYSIEIYFEVKKSKVNKVTIIDSLKILNFSVDKIAKDFNLPIRKLDLDYETIREKGHILTEHEIDYIRNDVEIMARALKIMFDQDLKKMTIGSDALYTYKKFNTNFNKYFPVLDFEIDKDIRSSYKGGFTYLNDKYENKETSSGIVLDVNSLYPSVMKFEKLPYSDPLFFNGKYKYDRLYNLYIQRFSCSFEIKKGKIPSLQIKNSVFFRPNEYVKSSNGDIVTLTLTNVDLELFFEQYDVYDIEYHSGWKFKSINGLFTEYIDYWTEQKINAKKEKNKSLYLISKLMLNSLYGKFGLNPNVQGKYPVLIDGVVKYKMYPAEIRDSIYCPLATFITSYARKKTITTSQKIRDYSLNKYGKDLYIYSDTDSIHCLFDSTIDENGNIKLTDKDKELYDVLDIDPYRLGAWDLESRFKKGKFIRQKCYIESDFDDNLSVTVAGLPKKLGKYINFDNFDVGFTTENKNFEDSKLTYKHVKGGVLLAKTDFSIK